MNRLEPATAIVTMVAFIAVIESVIKPIMYIIRGYLKRMGPFNLGEELYGCTPREFELACGIILKENQFESVSVTPGGHDGGVDIRCRKDGKDYFVECKRYLNNVNARYAVDVDIVRKLLGAMVAGNVYNGIIMTTGRISNEAKEFMNTLPHKYRIIYYDCEFFDKPIEDFNTDKISLQTSN